MNPNNPKSETKYDVNYFINYFSAIPENLWHCGDYTNNEQTKFCALAHCGEGVNCEGTTAMSNTLNNITTMYLIMNVSNINDGHENKYQQPTPKQRILAALYDIKRMQEEEQKINYRTVLVQVDEKVKQLTEVEFSN